MDISEKDKNPATIPIISKGEDSPKIVRNKRGEKIDHYAYYRCIGRDSYRILISISELFASIAFSTNSFERTAYIGRVRELTTDKKTSRAVL